MVSVIFIDFQLFYFLTRIIPEYIFESGNVTPSVLY